MIRFGSVNVSEAIQIAPVDADGVSAPTNLTGMTLEARFFDVGHVGQGGGIDDYGSHLGNYSTPLLTMAIGSGLVVDTAASGLLHLEMTAAQSAQIASMSIVQPATVKRRLVRQIWRTDAGFESVLQTATEWGKA